MSPGHSEDRAVTIIPVDLVTDLSPYWYTWSQIRSITILVHLLVTDQTYRHILVHFGHRPYLSPYWYTCWSQIRPIAIYWYTWSQIRSITIYQYTYWSQTISITILVHLLVTDQTYRHILVHLVTDQIYHHTGTLNFVGHRSDLSPYWYTWSQIRSITIYWYTWSQIRSVTIYQYTCWSQIRSITIYQYTWS